MTLFMLLLIFIAIVSLLFWFWQLGKDSDLLLSKPTAPTTATILYQVDPIGNYVLIIAPDLWPVFSQYIARGTKDYGITDCLFIQTNTNPSSHEAPHDDTKPDSSPTENPPAGDDRPVD